jgi:hypothetical protein
MGTLGRATETTYTNKCIAAQTAGYSPLETFDSLNFSVRADIGTGRPMGAQANLACGPAKLCIVVGRHAQLGLAIWDFMFIVILRFAYVEG